MEEEERRLKMAVISGAARALEFKDKNPRAQKEDIMQHIADKAQDILENIDDPL